MQIIEQLRSRHLLFPPASEEEIALLARKGYHDALLDFYRVSNGAYLYELEEAPEFDCGNFKHEGREFQLAIPCVRYAVNMYEFGFIYDDADYLEEAHTWYMVLDLRDGDCLAIETQGQNRVLFMDHEQSGYKGCHPIVAESLEDFLKLLLLTEADFWKHLSDSKSNCI